MTTKEKNQQQLFWEGAFGNEYSRRNVADPEDRKPFFSRVLGNSFGVRSICELGANKGHNLEAISRLSKNYELTGVEINEDACAIMEKIAGVKAIHSSIQDFLSEEIFDLVFTCGVLIHIHPDDLNEVFQKIESITNRYVLFCEYFNQTPVELSYRGHEEKLFKCDFAGDFIDATGNKFQVVNYGFLWRRVEPAWDDVSWFLLERVLA